VGVADHKCQNMVKYDALQKNNLNISFFLHMKDVYLCFFGGFFITSKYKYHYQSHINVSEFSVHVISYKNIRVCDILKLQEK
jgi:hypothetical protein